MTSDARGCQKAIAQQIGEQEAEYVLALTQNHGTLYEAVEQRFQEALPTAGEEATLQASETEEQQHGRGEIRRHWTLAAPIALVQKDAWTQLRCLGMGESERPRKGQGTIEQRSDIASITHEVKPVAHAVRAHWGMEKCVHWGLAMAFREDDARVRLGPAPENFAVLRPIALHLLRQDSTAKGGIHTKRLKAGWDEAYLATLVFGHTF